MKLPFFTTFLIFIAILTFQLKRTEGKSEKIEENFWAREQKANFTRKKDIEGLPYINFTLNSLPFHPELEDVRASEYLGELSELVGKRILNCTGLSNTDLKLKYGAANITRLTEYDQNYTVLVRNLARLAERYLLQDSTELRADAKTILEYGISIGTDVRLNYELLADLYAEQGKYDSIMGLRKKAETLNSLSREPILRSLDKIMPV